MPVRERFRPPHPRRRRALRLLAVAAVLTVTGGALLAGPTTAAPTQDRAHVGYPDVATNGFGGSESWGGSLRLFTGHDQSGEAIIGYCIQRGLLYPRGLDPHWADANSGFRRIHDVPAARGVPAAERAALSYSLWRYGDTADARTAGAMFLLTHLLSGDPDFGSTTLATTALGADWPNRGAVRQRAADILAESRRHRGPWTLDVTARRRDDGRIQAAVTLRGPGGPIAGVGVDVQVNGAGGTGRYTTDAEGRITLRETPNGSGAVTVRAVRATTPAPYRVFHGRAGTQQVITSGGDGPAIQARAVVDAVWDDGAIELRKRDGVDGERVAGARFRISADDDGDGTFETPVGNGPDGDADTDDDGIWVSAGPDVPPTRIENLRAGRYEVVEVTPPPGFTLPAAHARRRVVTVAAPPSGDPVTIVVDLDNHRPVVHTQVVPAADVAPPESNAGTGDDAVASTDALVGAAGGDDRPLLVTADTVVVDQVSFDHVAPDANGEVEVSWSGPFRREVSVSCHDPVGSTTVDVAGADPVAGPPVPLAEPGWYTFGAEVTLDDGGRGSHPCGVPAETVAVVALTTEASADEVVAGDDVVDTVHLHGAPDRDDTTVSGRLDVALYGPFASVDDVDCADEHRADRREQTVHGVGPFTTEAFTPTEAGVYTFAATWHLDPASIADTFRTPAEGVSVRHACGIPSETFTVQPPPPAPTTTTGPTTTSTTAPATTPSSTPPSQPPAPADPTPDATRPAVAAPPVHTLAATGSTPRTAAGAACLLSAGVCLVTAARRWPTT